MASLEILLEWNHLLKHKTQELQQDPRKKVLHTPPPPVLVPCNQPIVPSV